MSLRIRLLLASVLVVVTSIFTVLVVAVLLGPTLHDRLMTEMGMPLHDDVGEMTAMARATETAFVDAMLQALLVAGALALLVSVVVSFTTSRRLVAPIQSLLTASQRIAAGSHRERVPEVGDRELRALAVQFNIMAAELATTEQRRQALIADVAHELRTPLATVQGYAEGLLDGIVAPEPATWALLRDEAARLQRLIVDLDELALADAQQLRLTPSQTSTIALIERAVSVVRPHCQERGIALHVDVAYEDNLLLVDHDRMVQVLVNLLSNALRATPPSGQVQISCLRDNDDIQLTITDTGIGITAEHLAHVFERFYRVDPARSRATGGTGVGLTIARAIVEAHGGTLILHSDGRGQGTTARILLPVRSPYGTDT